MDQNQTELDLLKERANQMGISYGPRISVETLRARIDAKLTGAPAPPDDDEGDDENTDTANAGGINENGDMPQDAAPERPLTKHELLQKQRKEQLRLHRVRISNLNPMKKALLGEIFSVSNRVLGTVRKYIPYGEATDNGYHVPHILLEELKSRQFNQVKTKRLPGGRMEITSRLVKEFAIEVLPPLTQEELEKLARNQAAAAGL